MQKVGTIDNVTIKNGETRRRRNLLICDESNASICLCIWGDKVNLDFENNPVLAIKGAKVSDYFKRSLNAYDDARVYINCTFERAKDMKLWYECLIDDDARASSQPKVEFKQLSDGIEDALNGKAPSPTTGPPGKIK